MFHADEAAELAPMRSGNAFAAAKHGCRQQQDVKGLEHDRPCLRQTPGKVQPENSARIVIQPRAEPAFHFGHGFIFPFCQILDLVFAKFADGEIF